MPLFKHFIFFRLAKKNILLKMKYLAICTDLDDTLLDDERNLSVETLNTFKRLSPDIKIILASARMPRAMRTFRQQLNIEHTPVICYNGSLVIKYTEAGSVAVIFSKYIPTWLCAIFVSYVKKTDLHLSLFSDDNWFAPQLDKWAKTEILNTQVQPEIINNDDVIQQWQFTNHPGAHKVMCMGEADAVTELNNFFADNYSNELIFYRSDNTHLEIAPSGTSKANALSDILKSEYDFGIDRVIAFGDNENDLDLITSVGFGIAVANAKTALKEVADAITLKNTEHGVAVAVKEHFNYM